MTSLRRLRTPCLALLIPLLLSAAPSEYRRKRCYGESPCDACKNCKYCERCAKKGGECGACKKPDPVPDDLRPR